MLNVIENKVIKDTNIRSVILADGYKVVGNIGTELLLQLKNQYKELHDFNAQEGGMFYSLYSSDLKYRKVVNDQIELALKSIYELLFQDYKTVINSFIVKLPGPKSDFTLHQDSTGLDEFQYSPLSAWIPLQDTSLTNGTLCVIPKTHGFFYPYRGISFGSPFANYEDLLRKYLVPINLKAGDILLFDNRIVHYSHLNNSTEERVVVMSGIFPKEADFISVYKDESERNSPIEIFKQTDDFLLTGTAFYENCTDRPYRGELLKIINEPLGNITVYDFLSWASKNDVVPTNIPELVDAKLNMQIVAEPRWEVERVKIEQ